MFTEFTQYIDLAQITLYLFWIFFFGLIYWLRKEDRREGYPLEKDNPRIVGNTSNLLFPSPKTFALPDGSLYMAPDFERDTRDIAAERTANSGGSPLEPTGDPMLDGVGPAAWAERHDVPELSREGHPAVVPLRAAEGFRISAGPDVRGWEVIAGDGEVAGTVSEIWVDRLDMLIRYLEVELLDAASEDGEAATDDEVETDEEAKASDDEASEEESGEEETASDEDSDDSEDEDEASEEDSEDEDDSDDDVETDEDESKAKAQASAEASDDDDEDDDDEEYDEDPEPPRMASSASTKTASTRLVPMPLVKVSRGKGVVHVSSIHAKHFADVPTTKEADTITVLEEEKISAYFAGGRLYADPKRLGPVV